jgi:hypothetical protein
MKKLLCIFALLCNLAQAQIIQHNIADDSYAHVPLQFPFPLYGRIFTDSFMFSNGVVGFGSVNNHWCCSGYDLRNSQGYQFNYSIMGLQTDLINYGSGRFLTEGTPQYQRYYWENISEFGAPQNLNTFGIEIRPSGYIGMFYNQVNISPWRPVTIGVTGDTTQGEFSQFYHGNGISQGNFSHIIEATGNLCLSNPLSSPTCPNYQQALLEQNCTINPLYATTCTGYAQAYFSEQCRVNPLYDRNCSGYAEAYALANVVPSTSNNTVSTQSPQVLVSSTGTVSVETPVVADPVVNEVITRPTQTTTTNAQTQTTIQTVSQTPKESQKESKDEKKSEVKQMAKPSDAQTKVEVSVSTSIGIAPTIKSAEIPKGFDIIDYSHKKLIANLPSIRENRRILWMTNDSDKRHREMVDGQWRKD